MSRFIWIILAVIVNVTTSYGWFESANNDYFGVEPLPYDELYAGETLPIPSLINTYDAEAVPDLENTYNSDTFSESADPPPESLSRFSDTESSAGPLYDVDGEVDRFSPVFNQLRQQIGYKFSRNSDDFLRLFLNVYDRLKTEDGFNLNANIRKFYRLFSKVYSDVCEDGCEDTAKFVSILLKVLKTQSSFHPRKGSSNVSAVENEKHRDFKSKKIGPIVPLYSNLNKIIKHLRPQIQRNKEKWTNKLISRVTRTIGKQLNRKSEDFVSLFINSYLSVAKCYDKTSRRNIRDFYGVFETLFSDYERKLNLDQRKSFKEALLKVVRKCDISGGRWMRAYEGLFSDTLSEISSSESSPNEKVKSSESVALVDSVENFTPTFVNFQNSEKHVKFNFPFPKRKPYIRRNGTKKPCTVKYESPQRRPGLLKPKHWRVYHKNQILYTTKAHKKQEKYVKPKPVSSTTVAAWTKASLKPRKNKSQAADSTTEKAKPRDFYDAITVTVPDTFQKSTVRSGGVRDITEKPYTLKYETTVPTPRESTQRWYPSSMTAPTSTTTPTVDVSQIKKSTKPGILTLTTPTGRSVLLPKVTLNSSEKPKVTAKLTTLANPSSAPLELTTTVNNSTKRETAQVFFRFSTSPSKPVTQRQRDIIDNKIPTKPPKSKAKGNKGRVTKPTKSTARPTDMKTKVRTSVHTTNRPISIPNEATEAMADDDDVNRKKNQTTPREGLTTPKSQKKFTTITTASTRSKVTSVANSVKSVTTTKPSRKRPTISQHPGIRGIKGDTSERATASKGTTLAYVGETATASVNIKSSATAPSKSSTRPITGNTTPVTTSNAHTSTPPTKAPTKGGGKAVSSSLSKPITNGTTPVPTANTQTYTSSTKSLKMPASKSANVTATVLSTRPAKKSTTPVPASNTRTSTSSIKTLTTTPVTPGGKTATRPVLKSTTPTRATKTQTHTSRQTSTKHDHAASGELSDDDAASKKTTTVATPKQRNETFAKSTKSTVSGSTTQASVSESVTTKIYEKYNVTKATSPPVKRKSSTKAPTKPEGITAASSLSIPIEKRTTPVPPTKIKTISPSKRPTKSKKSDELAGDDGISKKITPITKTKPPIATTTKRPKSTVSRRTTQVPVKIPLTTKMREKKNTTKAPSHSVKIKISIIAYLKPRGTTAMSSSSRPVIEGTSTKSPTYTSSKKSPTTAAPKPRGTKTTSFQRRPVTKSTYPVSATNIQPSTLSLLSSTTVSSKPESIRPTSSLSSPVPGSTTPAPTTNTQSYTSTSKIPTMKTLKSERKTTMSSLSTSVPKSITTAPAINTKTYTRSIIPLTNVSSKHARVTSASNASSPGTLFTASIKLSTARPSKPEGMTTMSYVSSLVTSGTTPIKLSTNRVAKPDAITAKSSMNRPITEGTTPVPTTNTKTLTTSIKPSTMAISKTSKSSSLSNIATKSTTPIPTTSTKTYTSSVLSSTRELSKHEGTTASFSISSSAAESITPASVTSTKNYTSPFKTSTMAPSKSASIRAKSSTTTTSTPAVIIATTSLSSPVTKLTTPVPAVKTQTSTPSSKLLTTISSKSEGTAAMSTLRNPVTESTTPVPVTKPQTHTQSSKLSTTARSTTKGMKGARIISSAITQTTTSVAITKSPGYTSSIRSSTVSSKPKGMTASSPVTQSTTLATAPITQTYAPPIESSTKVYSKPASITTLRSLISPVTLITAATTPSKIVPSNAIQKTTTPVPTTKVKSIKSPTTASLNPKDKTSVSSVRSLVTKSTTPVSVKSSKTMSSLPAALRTTSSFSSLARESTTLVPVANTQTYTLMSKLSKTTSAKPEGTIAVSSLSSPVTEGTTPVLVTTQAYSSSYIPPTTASSMTASVTATSSLSSPITESTTPVPVTNVQTYPSPTTVSTKPASITAASTVSSPVTVSTPVPSIHTQSESPVKSSEASESPEDETKRRRTTKGLLMLSTVKPTADVHFTPGKTDIEATTEEWGDSESVTDDLSTTLSSTLGDTEEERVPTTLWTSPLERVSTTPASNMFPPTKGITESTTLMDDYSGKSTELSSTLKDKGFVKTKSTEFPHKPTESGVQFTTKMPVTSQPLVSNLSPEFLIATNVDGKPVKTAEEIDWWPEGEEEAKRFSAELDRQKNPAKYFMKQAEIKKIRLGQKKASNVNKVKPTLVITTNIEGKPAPVVEEVNWWPEGREEAQRFAAELDRNPNVGMYLLKQAENKRLNAGRKPILDIQTNVDGRVIPTGEKKWWTEDQGKNIGGLNPKEPKLTIKTNVEGKPAAVADEVEWWPEGKEEAERFAAQLDRQPHLAAYLTRLAESKRIKLGKKPAKVVGPKIQVSTNIGDQEIPTVDEKSWWIKQNNISKPELQISTNIADIKVPTAEERPWWIQNNRTNTGNAVPPVDKNRSGNRKPSPKLDVSTHVESVPVPSADEREWWLNGGQLMKGGNEEAMMKNLQNAGKEKRTLMRPKLGISTNVGDTRVPTSEENEWWLKHSQNGGANGKTWGLEGQQATGFIRGLPKLDAATNIGENFQSQKVFQNGQPWQQSLGPTKLQDSNGQQWMRNGGAINTIDAVDAKGRNIQQWIGNTGKLKFNQGLANNEGATNLYNRMQSTGQGRGSQNSLTYSNPLVPAQQFGRQSANLYGKMLPATPRNYQPWVNPYGVSNPQGMYNPLPINNINQQGSIGPSNGYAYQRQDNQLNRPGMAMYRNVPGDVRYRAF